MMTLSEHILASQRILSGTNKHLNNAKKQLEFAKKSKLDSAKPVIVALEKSINALELDLQDDVNLKFSLLRQFEAASGFQFEWPKK